MLVLLLQAAARHDGKLAEVVLRLAAVEREAETAATAARQQHVRRVSELETSGAALEQRGLTLAQSVASKQVCVCVSPWTPLGFSLHRGGLALCTKVGSRSAPWTDP